MNEEIKEILEYLKNINNYDYSEICDNENNVIEKDYDIYLSKNKIDVLLDCITNLQKENNHLSKSYAEAILFNQKRCEQNKELQQRIDKAIEYIKEDGTTYLNLANQRKWCSEFSAENILKILGGDK